MNFDYWILLLIFRFYLLTSSLVVAYDDLSYQKLATQSTTSTGTYDLYKAANAVDRNIATCMRTDQIGPTSPDNTMWWKVDLGGVYNIYSVNILFKNYDGNENRQRGRLAGFSIYVSKTGDREKKYLCYKDGQQLPPLNFTTTCELSGRYVIFYNERLPGVVYPSGYEVSLVFMELCEVTVYGCYRDGVYGSSCDAPCPSNCKTNTCSILNGKCSECKPGWMGTTCNAECAYGLYGVDCKQPCPGNCRNNATCNHLTGLCDAGCAAGWNGSLCNKVCPDGLYGFYCTQRCSGNCKENSPCNHTTGFCDTGCAVGWNGSLCDKECAECVNVLPDRTTPYVENSSTGNVLPKGDSSEDKSSGSVVGGAVGACVALITVIVVVLVIGFKRRSVGIPTKNSHLISEKEMDTTVDRHLQRGERKTVDTKSRPYSKDDIQNPPKTAHLINKTISVLNIRAHITDFSAEDNAGFKDEYKSIPRGELHPCSVARKTGNSAKNRYTDMYPYDHSRVVLKDTQDGNDYINANYIENTRGKRCYIATQGPKSKTVTDFWTMVWQEEVSSIVCLTNLKEGNKNKCTQYWPNINDKQQSGNIIIKHVEERVYAEHIVRRFKMCHSSKRADRLVTMYHYTAWADHGVADPLSLVVFHRQVMKATAQSTGKYTLVHCSAGMGRTGTYIALDVLYKEGERNGEINVPMYVRTMRKDRINMVQVEDQYIVLYLALAEAFSGQPRAMTKETFIKKYQGQNSDANVGDMTLSSEFEELLSLRKVYSQDDFASGRTNISANYTQSVLPVENYLCSLSNAEGRSTYYNAVYLQSFLEKDAFISAQYPLPKFTEDFLRLVTDYCVRIVVFLCPIKDLKSTSVWFPKKNQSKSIGNFTVTQTSSTNTPNITKNKLRLQKGLDNMDISVMECPTWRDGQLTENKRILMDVIKEVKTEKDNQDGPILVLTSDGATSCGALCVVYNAIEQIAVDGEVDIFTTARQLQVRRPEFLSTWAEYQLCHAAVAEYLSNENKYGIF